jgi:hypothetical protein
MREQFQVDLPLRALFDAPTVEKLSERVRSEKERQKSEAAVLSDEIDLMDDAAVAARIAQLESELGTRDDNRAWRAWE